MSAHSNEYRRTPLVWCRDCEEFHPVKGVEVLDYSSDVHERDQVIFNCPSSGKRQISLVVVK